MNKADYVQIANILRKTDDKQTIVERLANYFETENNHFNRSKFILATSKKVY